MNEPRKAGRPGVTVVGRPGVTVVELIVVIAIVAVLIGLLLPAIQRVRDSAQRSACTNNLRQLVLSSHNYHDIRHRLPPGVRAEPGFLPWMGWQGYLLPHLDQGPLWQQIQKDYEAQLAFNENLASANTFVSTFVCPSDSLVSDRNYGWRAYYTNYFGVSGVSVSLQLQGLEKPPAGVLYLDSRVRLSDVSDGLASTLFAGERMTTRDRTFGHWHHSLGWPNGTADSVLGVEEGEIGERPVSRICLEAYFKAGRTSDPCDQFHYWSFHVGGGGNFAFCDGSVRFLTYQSRAILPALATRSGGEVAVFD